MTGLRIPTELIAAVDAYRATQDPAPSRSEVIRFALRDWLTGLGFLKHRENPEGVNGTE